MDADATGASGCGNGPDAAAVGRAFGTFGELLQGVLYENGRDFLVTLPIDAWSTARARLAESGVAVWPPHKTKSLKLARLVMRSVGYTGGCRLELASDIPEGKGLASSSADLVATARAVGALFGLPMGASDIEGLLRQIEPSDGVMHDGIVAFYHREVAVREWFGHLPPMSVIAHDHGGQVDTVRHNRDARPLPSETRREYSRLLSEIGQAIRHQELDEVGRIATRSAQLGLPRFPGRRFDELQRACHEIDGRGLVLAHSGTMLGILLNADDPELDRKREFVGQLIEADVAVYRTLGAEQPPATHSPAEDCDYAV